LRAMRSAMLRLNPAAHVGVAVRDPAVAGEYCFGKTSGQPRERSCNFVGRARGLRADGPIRQRIGVGILERRPVSGGDRRNELIGVIGRH
jgi:hypothetical protein